MPRHRRRNTRRQNGAGLGAFLGSLVGAVVGGLGGIPLATVGSIAGGAVGGHYGAQSDRQRRGAVGGGVGGIGGPLFAALGGWIGGMQPDRKSNPSGLAITAWALGALAVIGLPTAYYLRKRKQVQQILSTLPGSVPPRQMPTIAGEPYFILDEARFTYKGGVVQGRIEEAEVNGEQVYYVSVMHTPLGGVAEAPISKSFPFSERGQLGAWFDGIMWLAEKYASYDVATEQAVGAPAGAPA